MSKKKKGKKKIAYILYDKDWYRDKHKSVPTDIFEEIYNVGYTNGYNEGKRIAARNGKQASQVEALNRHSVKEKRIRSIFKKNNISSVVPIKQIPDFLKKHKLKIGINKFNTLQKEILG